MYLIYIWNDWAFILYIQSKNYLKMYYFNDFHEEKIHLYIQDTEIWYKYDNGGLLSLKER